MRNYVTDQNTPAYLNYDGRINIEIRGSSSQTLPKKQYGLTTYKADNVTKVNVSLLGMPADNDWIFNGLGYEPSCIRDYLCFNLSRKIGEYASRTMYFEMILNGTYNGLYVLQEKIKQGSERVDIMKIATTDNDLPNVSGGYITKADKSNGDPVAWTMSSYIGTDDVTFINDQPKPDEVTPAQDAYIQSVFENLSSTASAGNTSLVNGYPSIIDVPSFVDFMIISELSANADAYQFSTFFHKDRNGKLRAGPIWDNNLTFGYDLYIWNFNRSKTNTWQFSNGDNEGPRFWTDLFNNPEFKCYFSRRWNQLIQPGQPLNLASIDTLIDRVVATISEATVRENQKWNTLGNFPDSIAKIKTWLSQRINWMTTNLGPFTDCSNVKTPPLVITKIMYNPSTTADFPNSKDQEFIEIKNTGTNTEDLAGVYFSGTGFVYQFPAYSMILPNSTKILTSNSAVFTAKYGFPPSGQFTRNLSNDGKLLVLADGFGNVIDSVRYSNQPPWPDADGNGYYLELTDPLSDNSVATNWIASDDIIIMSVENTENNQGLKFYPIPVKENLTIESYGRIDRLQLFDFQGCLLQTVSINSATYALDMSTYSPGAYLIDVITSDGSFVRKIIKE